MTRTKESFLYTRGQVQPDKSVNSYTNSSYQLLADGVQACKERVQNLPVMTHQTTGNQEMFLLVLSLY